jgi:hypothetical protein
LISTDPSWAESTLLTSNLTPVDVTAMAPPRDQDSTWPMNERLPRLDPLTSARLSAPVDAARVGPASVGAEPTRAVRPRDAPNGIPGVVDQCRDEV